MACYLQERPITRVDLRIQHTLLAATVQASTKLGTAVAASRCAGQETAMHTAIKASRAAAIVPAGKPTTSAALPISEGSVMRKLRGVGRAASCVQLMQMVPC